MGGRLKSCSTNRRNMIGNNGKIVPFRQVENLYENRLQKWKQHCLADLTHWFHRYWRKENEAEWQAEFKELLDLPINEPIPRTYQLSFQYWLLFDAKCMNHRRPVELWASTARKNRPFDRFLHSFVHSVFDCLELMEERKNLLIFTSLLTGKQYEVEREDISPDESIIFARLIRMGSRRYQIFGPYASFVRGMRGEIMVQLEKYKRREGQQDFVAREDGWKLLGWAIHKAKETQQIDRSISSTTDVTGLKDNSMEKMKEREEKKQPRLPVYIMQQLEKYYVNQVQPLQKKTQAYHSKSLELLFEYVTVHFGHTFDWSMMTEDVFSHFLGVWYIDQGKPTPNGSRVFLNTLKNLFRWLSNEGYSNAYQSFKKVYIHLIRALPATLEVKKWLKEHGRLHRNDINPSTKQPSIFMISVSTAGPAVFIENQWKECQLKNFPTLYTNQHFWVRGYIKVEDNSYIISEINELYPMIPLDDEYFRDKLLIDRK